VGFGFIGRDLDYVSFLKKTEERRQKTEDRKCEVQFRLRTPHFGLVLQVLLRTLYFRMIYCHGSDYQAVMDGTSEVAV